MDFRGGIRGGVVVVGSFSWCLCEAFGRIEGTRPNSADPRAFAPPRRSVPTIPQASDTTQGQPKVICSKAGSIK